MGATNLPALKNIRGAAPEAWILCPGVGAQGGQAMDVCNFGRHYLNRIKMLFFFSSLLYSNIISLVPLILFSNLTIFSLTRHLTLVSPTVLLLSQLSDRASSRRQRITCLGLKRNFRRF